MVRVPENLRYSKTHEWVDLVDGVATIGISAFAVEELTDLVFMALPSIGAVLSAGSEFGEVESVKAVSPLNSPMSGTVLEVHEKLIDQLEILGEDPYEKGWILRIQVKDKSELDSLMSYAQYQLQCNQSH